jgi:hypothetical protein
MDRQRSNLPTYLGLFLMGLLIFGGIAAFQPHPGYIDADYYFAGGLRLARGYGFSEVFPWNYLDDPQSLPKPSHTYWNPLASIIAALGIVIAHNESYRAAQAGFVLLAALVPPATAALAFDLAARRSSPDSKSPRSGKPETGDVNPGNPIGSGLLAGLLALLPTFLAPYLPVTDNLGAYMLLGALFFLLLGRTVPLAVLLAGAAAGLMNLARSDGMLWAGAGIIVIALQSRGNGARAGAAQMAIFAAGYLLTMGPWLARNLLMFGSPLAPGNVHVLWLTRYYDTLAYPAARLTSQNWLASGWEAIVAVRASALQSNSLETIFQIGGILLPFMLLGGWVHRRDARVLAALLIWIATFGAMTALFPFSAERGSYGHATAALLPLGWALVPAGLESVARAAERRSWKSAPRIRRELPVYLLIFTAALTLGLTILYLAPPEKGQDPARYQAVEQRILEDQTEACPKPCPNGAPALLAVNPPLYYALNNRPALMIPHEDRQAVLQLAAKFGARYLLLEKGFIYSDDLVAIYDNPWADPHFTLISDWGDAKLFRIR